jgi:CRISP-associated protein Cas1
MNELSQVVKSPLRVFPCEITLKMTGPARLHAHHAAILYALVAESQAKGSDDQPGIPDGVLLDAPEQSRLSLAAGEQYTFGLQILATDDHEATQRLEPLLRGLKKVGVHGTRGKKPFSGNFIVQNVHYIAGNRPSGPLPGSPSSIAPEYISREQEQARGLSQLTLRFLSPLRWERPKPARTAGGAYFDENYFSADLFARRTIERAVSLGYPFAPADVAPSDVSVVENHLVWLDLTYGHSSERKPMSGAVGRVVLKSRSAPVTDALVLGQFLRVGGQTRFGFGCYRIEELGPAPFRAQRSMSLVELAITDRRVDRLASLAEVPSGVVSRQIRAIRQGTYQPRPPVRVIIGADNPRVLSIPAPEDRVLQRAVLDTIAPALDLFFEESSMAYRKGLGRYKASFRIRDAYRDGYHWALKSDFHRFFDSIDHRLLRERLDAYLADDRLVELIMLWVGSGAVQPGRGLPTGSVLSPILANLFLDQFDERVAREGARLVRYADDFLILFRDEAMANAVYQAAYNEAEQLRLTLNQEKTHLLDLTQPFVFLGFRFHRDEQWQMSPSGQLAHIDDLGWREAHAAPPVPAKRPVLPGESPSDFPDTSEHAAVIVGPHVTWIGASHDDLIIRFGDEKPEHRIASRRIGDLVALGPPTVDSSVFESRSLSAAGLLIGDASGRLLHVVSADATLDNAVLVCAQVAASNDSARRLTIARALVRSKLLNHAALAEACPPKKGPRDDLASALRQLAGKASQAGALEELIGFEGAGGAQWYAGFARRIDPHFTFEKRVAPDAEDPVNVLLNIGQTLLHRLVGLALAREGLAISLGFLHQIRSGHAALASDLQEPFRHLVDRAVIEATSVLQPGQFHEDPSGPFPLRIDGAALREFMALVFRGLAVSCQAPGQTEAKPYRQHLHASARSLHRHLLDPKVTLEVFTHP